MKRSLYLAAAALLGLAASSAGHAADMQPGRAAALLQKLLTFDTSNPPGDTKALAEFLKTQFEPLGAQVEVIPTPKQPGPVHFIARLKGDGSKPPVLVAAHSDVVPVERSHWTVDPFAGVVKDGYVLGRGAMDFKGGLAVFATAVMMLAENKVPLDRDVIFLSEADEEAGDYGTDWLAENHWDKIDAEFALNEGGWIFQNKDGAARQVNVTTRDKIYLTLKLSATGTPTHSSRPALPKDSAIGRLSVALARLAASDTEPKLNDQTRSYFEALARSAGEPLAGRIRTLVEGKDAAARRQAGEEIVAAGDYPLLWHALMRDTVAVTMLEGGIKENVIPGSAAALVNMRLVPGSTLDDAIGEVRAIIQDPQIEISVPAYPSLDAAREAIAKRTAEAASSIDTELYRALAANAEAVWPKVEVVPALFEAGTDAVAWRAKGIPVYGIYPYPLDNETLLRMHGNDERIGVQALDQGTEWVYRTLVEVAGKK
ncbi:M20/M25/M40 family metallo-hydrolase [Inquilinus sp. YAF38]|uniref:M20/M25/M40 family metallo-hydrolase n=1 Tax=Inquilinus sp. YAF38 TaxID=3233084 RepID=UPI003F90E965